MPIGVTELVLKRSVFVECYNYSEDLTNIIIIVYNLQG